MMLYVCMDTGMKLMRIQTEEWGGPAGGKVGNATSMSAVIPSTTQGYHTDKLTA